MTRKIFGTDGIRGRANTHPMTAEMALKLGAAAGRFFRTDGANRHRVVIGKDTRLSGYMLENALTAGLTSTGMNVLLLGPVPTPAEGHLTKSMRADLGIMISASHNPYHVNGIKFFGNLIGGTPAGALENHVLDKVGNPAFAFGFIPGTHIDPHPHGHRARVRQFLGQNPNAVIKNGFSDGHVHCPRSTTLYGSGGFFHPG